MYIRYIYELVSEIWTKLIYQKLVQSMPQQIKKKALNFNVFRAFFLLFNALPQTI